MKEMYRMKDFKDPVSTSSMTAMLKDVVAWKR